MADEEVPGSGPMFGGFTEPASPTSFNAFGGMGGVGGALFNIGGGMLADSVFAQAGLLPGQFFQTQSYFDQVRARENFHQQQRAMATAAAADSVLQMQMARGVAAMLGQPLLPDSPQERAVRRAVTGFRAVSPFIAQMAPELFDSMHGTRGSAQVMSMYMNRAGLLGVDPVTGGMGLSGESAGVLAGEIHNRLFGPGADVRALRGISAGRLGMLAEELQVRGLGAEPIGGAGRGEQLDRMAADPEFVAGLRTRLGRPPRAAPAAGGDREFLASLQAEAPDDFSGALRQFDAKRTGDRLREMAGAVSAVRDLLGPGAPMRQVVETLNQLTQQGTLTMSPERLEMAVRTAHGMARSTGLGIQGFMALSAAGAGQADRLGMARDFVTDATIGAASFGTAFRQSGLAGVPMFNAMSVEEMTLMDQRLRLRGAQSGAGNQLGMAMRIADTLGDGFAGPGRALTEAVRAGESEFLNPLTGRRESVVMQDADFHALMRASGVDEATLTAMRRQSEANAAPASLYNVGDLVREAGQGREVREVVAKGAAGALSGLVGEDAAVRAAVAASEAVAGMDQRDRRDQHERDVVARDAMRGALGRDGAGVSDARLLLAAEQGLGAANTELAERGQGGLVQALELTDPRTLRAGRERRERGRADAAIRRAVAGMGGAGPLERTVDEIMAQNKDGAVAAVGRVLGGIDPGELKGRLDRLGAMPDADLKKMGIPRAALEGALARMDTGPTAVDQMMTARARQDAEDERAAAEMRDQLGGFSVDDARDRLRAKPLVDGPGPLADPRAAVGLPAKAPAPAEAAANPLAALLKGGKLELGGTLTLVGLDKVRLEAKADGGGEGATPAAPPPPVAPI